MHDGKRCTGGLRGQFLPTWKKERTIRKCCWALQNGRMKAAVSGMHVIHSSEKKPWLLRWKNADVWKWRGGSKKRQKEVGVEKEHEALKDITVLLPSINSLFYIPACGGEFETVFQRNTQTVSANKWIRLTLRGSECVQVGSDVSKGQAQRYTFDLWYWGNSTLGRINTVFVTRTRVWPPLSATLLVYSSTAAFPGYVNYSSNAGSVGFL